MDSFKEYIEEREFIEFVENQFVGAAPTKQSVGGKPWSAKKKEILSMWRNLKPNMPIMISPMDKDRDKDTYGEDGLRITGTWQFISSVLSRFKDVLAYENPHTKLRLMFRGIEKGRDARPDRNSFVFYLNLDRRSHGKAGRPKKGELRIGRINI